MKLGRYKGICTQVEAVENIMDLKNYIFLCFLHITAIVGDVLEQVYVSLTVNKEAIANTNFVLKTFSSRGKDNISVP